MATSRAKSGEGEGGREGGRGAGEPKDLIRAAREEEDDKAKQELLVKEGFLGPVTALCWCPVSEILLVGRGRDLSFMSLSRKIFGEIRCFENGRIHGVRCVSSKVDGRSQIMAVVHSEKKISIVSAKISKEATDGDAELLVVCKDWMMDDWIMDVHTLTVDEAERSRQSSIEDLTRSCLVAVGLAHNVIQILEVRTRSVQQTVRCSEQPLLCSLNFSGSTLGNLRVACAGFTREILCWGFAGLDSAPVEQRLRGHTGVIHSVRWREDGAALVSASEDRSVILWLQTRGEAGAWPIFHRSATFWGHAARIWDCQGPLDSPPEGTMAQ
ncbi:hypothetical protein GUITHDRAFT_133294 [Guillardia theta CCMP2712]|uniref:Uncharacterized protein n=1 Tax=Guillardia theta (strain CCMP2712) TaxID=905079 RepID=L1JXE7_GUITC|nr:hypothetical protein GUITHDRAFT_133294 [Guillardia theta CCMP2712]EKX52875.1 hypothetical protein GUITHDRAFT_133294 [Guillardia theta CCMP2712]|eukprot:XP_005839855.1 hypothetical protein GUITHDRAFT_133294 [Guillardia theta CCMP2712]